MCSIAWERMHCAIKWAAFQAAVFHYHYDWFCEEEYFKIFLCLGLFICFMWIGWVKISAKHLQLLKLYNLLIWGMKTASSDCVQSASLHLSEAGVLFYKKDTASATQTFLVRNICPACFGVHVDTWSHAAEEMSSPFLLLQQSRTHSYLLSRSEEFIF